MKVRDETRDETRATRLAANVAAVAVTIYALLWVATTQVDLIREVSPFGEDPWDAVASYASIFLPIVAGATWIRSLRHRGATLPPVTAARIRWGAGLAVGIVLAAVGADLMAMATTVPVRTAPGDARPALVALLVAAAGLTAVAAAALLARAAFVSRAATAAAAPLVADDSPEPDVVDDLLALATDVSRPIGLGGLVGRLSLSIERFLDGSSLSPRRHRILFGVVLATGAAVAFDAWHAVVEGAWASPVVALIVGTLMAVGVLGIYLGTVVPLRLLRPAGSRRT
jgi:hypothetical protein